MYASHFKIASRQLTRKAAAAAGTPSIRRSEATVSVSSGPAPQAPVEKKKKREERSSSEHRKGSQERREDHSDARASLPHGGCAKIVEQERLATSPVSAAGHTHDKGYGKWNRFDIDAALRSVDEEDGTHGGSKVGLGAGSLGSLVLPVHSWVSTCSLGSNLVCAPKPCSFVILAVERECAQRTQSLLGNTSATCIQIARIRCRRLTPLLY